MVMHLELVFHQHPFPELDEIASAALQQKQQQKQNHTQQQMLLMPQSPNETQSTNGRQLLNAQEQDKQHIELPKQHPDLPEQALPPEIASAAEAAETAAEATGVAAHAPEPAPNLKQELCTGTRQSAAEGGKHWSRGTIFATKWEPGSYTLGVDRILTAFFFWFWDFMSILPAVGDLKCMVMIWPF